MVERSSIFILVEFLDVAPISMVGEAHNDILDAGSISMEGKALEFLDADSISMVGEAHNHPLDAGSIYVVGEAQIIFSKRG